MSHPTLFFYPRPRVDIAEVPALSHAGAVLLTDTLHATGLSTSLRDVLDPWTKPLAEHHAAKVLLDTALESPEDLPPGPVGDRTVTVAPGGVVVLGIAP